VAHAQGSTLLAEQQRNCPAIQCMMQAASMAILPLVHARARMFRPLTQWRLTHGRDAHLSPAWKRSSFLAGLWLGLPRPPPGPLVSRKLATRSGLPAAGRPSSSDCSSCWYAGLESCDTPAAGRGHWIHSAHPLLALHSRPWATNPGFRGHFRVEHWSMHHPEHQDLLPNRLTSRSERRADSEAADSRSSAEKLRRADANREGMKRSLYTTPSRPCLARVANSHVSRCHKAALKTARYALLIPCSS
jgi:hypothetical protein